jgi:hypothetical protein
MISPVVYAQRSSGKPPSGATAPLDFRQLSATLEAKPRLITSAGKASEPPAVRSRERDPKATKYKTTKNWRHSQTLHAPQAKYFLENDQFRAPIGRGSTKRESERGAATTRPAL